MKQVTALLMTDLVDSTLLTERLGDDAMSELLRLHDRTSRDLLSRWRGTEINRSDGFLLTFPSVVDAAGYAAAYHAGIASLSVPLRARAGLHVGPVVVRTNLAGDQSLGAKSSELAGLSISAVARVMTLARAGQTLMTAEARAALGHTDLRIESHGHWQLKGIEHPLEIFEIGERDAPFDAPGDHAKCYAVTRSGGGWRPRRDVPHSIPGARNAFVGRRSALRELAARLDANGRLVTVLGPGGTGKTRLVQHFGSNHLGDFEGGVWFCDLTQAITFDGLCASVAQGLRLPLGQVDPVDQIGAAIAERGDCLVILDNFEQVAGFALQSLGRWLDLTARARFLVTTRNVLGLDGEQILSLRPLDRDEGKQLFELRARAASQAFELEEDDHDCLAALIDLLDGLPLAIELAAARVRLLPIAGLLERMQERFNLLTSTQGRPSRQATLKATLDWSWELLARGEQGVVAQLSVFEGGFSLGAFEAVVPMHDEGPSDALQLLQSLIDKSWLQRDDDGRFGLLKSIQQYAALHLREATRSRPDDPATRDALRRHWQYFGSLDEAAATARRCADRDNLIAATQRAMAAGDASAASACLLSSWWTLRRSGPFRTAVELGERVRAMKGLMAIDLARIDFVIGNAWRHRGMDSEARTAFASALCHAESASARREETWIRAAMGELETHAKHWPRAEALFDDALRIARDTGNRASECAVLNSVGAMLQASDRAERSLDLYRDALKLARSLRDTHLEGGIVGNLGGAFYSLGRLDEAEDAFRRAILLARQSGSRRWEGNMRCNLGLVLLDRARTAEAIDELGAALRESRELGHLRLECTASWNLGLAYEASGDDARALDCFTLASAIARTIGDRGALAQLLLRCAILLASLRNLDQSLSSFDECEALARDDDDSETQVLLLCARATAEWKASRRAEARHSIARALRLVRRSRLEVGQAPRLNPLRKLVGRRSAADLTTSQDVV